MPTSNELNEQLRDTCLEFSRIKSGDVVVNLGAGSGNDCFTARLETGETGRVIGLDTTPDLLEQARQTTEKIGYTNVEFMQGDPEAMPLPGAVADVVVSTGGLSRVPDKQAVFDEIYRILKPGGHVCVSDVVLAGTWPDRIREAAEHHADYGSGAIDQTLYLDIISMSGFEDITLPKRDPIHLPDDLLTPHLTAEELAAFRASGTGLFSLTICAKKLVGDGLTLSAADLAMPLANNLDPNPDDDDLDDDDLARYDILGSL